MKKTFLKILGAAAVLLTPLTASAGSVYQDCSPCADVWCNPCDAVCGPKASLWEVGGWIEGGIYGNEYGQENAYANGYLRADSGNTSVLQNVRQSDFTMNQMYFFGQKKLSKRGWDIGGRVDLGFGTDMVYLQSANLEFDYVNSIGDDRWGTGDYYLALPQLYGEIGYNNVSVKVGKFLSTFGYESILSPDRFFYSMCYAYGARPATQTGALVTWDVTRNFSVFAGWTNGQNQTFENEDDNAFLGGFHWKYNNRLHVGYSLMVGSEDFRFGPDREYFYQSLFADVKLTKRANYVFEWTLNNENTGPFRTGAYGINNEFFYKLNKRWTVGARLEWMHYYSNVDRFGGFSDDAVAFTLGANWKPNKWFTLKPEVRYDVFDNLEPFNLVESRGTDPQNGQWSFGVSGMLKF